MSELLITKNTNTAAAKALYTRVDSRLPWGTCCSMADIVSDLPVEMPMGMSEKDFEKKQKLVAHRRLEATGLLPSGIFAFFARKLMLWALNMLVEHWLENKGWV